MDAETQLGATSLLYHGPAAQDAAMKVAKQGRMMCPPLGLDGLKVDEARTAVKYLSTRGIGDKRGVLVIGPLDLANEKACDVLLKSVEEIDPLGTFPVMWAHDLEEVPRTLSSRCRCLWVGGVRLSVEQEMAERAGRVMVSVEAGDINDLLFQVKGEKNLDALARAICQEVSRRLREGSEEEFLLRVWSRLRRELKHKIQTRIGLTHALLGACEVLADE